MRLDRFTIKAQEAIESAQSLGDRSGNPSVEPEHLLTALVGQEEGTVPEILRKLEVNPQQVLQSVREGLAKLPRVSGSASAEAYISPVLKEVLDLSVKEAEGVQDEYVGTEHLLLGLVGIKKGNVWKLLHEKGVTREYIFKVLQKIRGSHRITDPNPEEKYQALKKYGHDLTEMARSGKLDPVIGRDEEVRRIVQVLSRRTKNNPVLIGDPGVGKTAIVEGLAQRIVNGDVPEGLKNKRLITLDLPGMVAGAKYRGEFEDRLKAVLKEIINSRGEIVLFIDEIHTLVGAGAAEGAIDASNMLKPPLARGELRCVGATTLTEYRKYIEKDTALERRFQPIFVAEPSVEDTVAILRGLKEKYEVHHGVRIQDNALLAAAHLSHRYISDRFLPDKAVDLIDEAAAHIRIEIDSLPAEIDQVERRIRQLEIEKQALKKEEDEGSRSRVRLIDGDLDELRKRSDGLKGHWSREKAVIARIRSIKEELEKARTREQELERNGELEKLAELRYGRIPDLQKKLDGENKSLKELQSDQKILKEEVDEEDVAQIVSKWTRIPVSRLMEGEKQKLLHMEDRLRDRVVGQWEAVHSVSNAVRRARAGLSSPERPTGSFLFMGPTGVGKTELARALAEFLFDDEQNMIRIDMSEFMEKHSVSRLIGAPPGYVGYEEGGVLTEAVRRKPYSVILFDEIEKAHPEVFNLLLQILDDGRLTDGHGKTVDFKNTIVIMTSNIASPTIQKMGERKVELFGENAEEIGDDQLAELGKDPIYSRYQEEVVETLRKQFRPEFLNRLDEVIVFHNLSKNQIKRIVDIQLGILCRRLGDRKMRLELTDRAKDILAEKGFDPVYGARPLKRTIQKMIQDPLALGILEGRFLDNQHIRVDRKNGGDELVFLTGPVPKEKTS